MPGENSVRAPESMPASIAELSLRSDLASVLYRPQDAALEGRVPLSTPFPDALTRLRRSGITGAIACITAIIVVLVGGLVQVPSASAGTIPLVARVQAEQMRRPVGASNVKDVRAINGYAVKMTRSNTSLTKTFSLSGNATSLSVRAKGTKCNGGWPRMIVRVDGRTAVPLTTVIYAGWHTYLVKTSIAGGNPRLVHYARL